MVNILAVRLKFWIRIRMSTIGQRVSISRLLLKGSLLGIVFCPGLGCLGNMEWLLLILATLDGFLSCPVLSGFALVFSGLLLAISLLFMSRIRAYRIKIYISYETYLIELEPVLVSILISTKCVKLFILLFKIHHATMLKFRPMTHE